MATILRVACRRSRPVLGARYCGYAGRARLFSTNVDEERPPKPVVEAVSQENAPSTSQENQVLQRLSLAIRGANKVFNEI